MDVKRIDNTETLEVVRVRGLFGRFNYDLNINHNDGITMITGRMGTESYLPQNHDSVFNRELGFFMNLQFTKISVNFKSKKSLSIVRTTETESNSKKKKPASVTFSSFGFGADDKPFTLSRSER